MLECYKVQNSSFSQQVLSEVAASVVDKWLTRDKEAGERQRRPQFQNDMKFHK